VGAGLVGGPAAGFAARRVVNGYMNNHYGDGSSPAPQMSGNDPGQMQPSQGSYNPSIGFNAPNVGGSFFGGPQQFNGTQGGSPFGTPSQGFGALGQNGMTNPFAGQPGFASWGGQGAPTMGGGQGGVGSNMHFGGWSSEAARQASMAATQDGLQFGRAATGYGSGTNATPDMLGGGQKQAF
jgi:hypothetical protein